MAYDNPRQQQAADVRTSQRNFVLVITSSPTITDIGKALLDAGALGPGTYQCDFRCEGWKDAHILLKPTAVTGAFAPTAVALLWHLSTEHPTKTDVGANFVANTAEVLDLTDLDGLEKARVKFTVPGGGSVTFASATGMAEYYGI